jgi:NADPH:quinone reductase-like Zn-dependent oxidoreductase
MKAAVMVGPGFEAITIVDRDEDVVPAGHVRLKIKTASLNYRDLFLAKGYMPIPYPQIILSDAVGEVVEVGQGVTRVSLKDRVFPTFYPDWIEGRQTAAKVERDRGGIHPGVAAETVVVLENDLVKVPAFLSDDEASTLPCAALTGWSCVTRNVSLKPGASVLIQGTGGVSLFALQFAKAAGAEIFLISSSDEKLERGRALGADHLINYKTNEAWDEVILEETGGRGVDLVVEIGGESTIGRSVNSLAVEGHISQAGIIGGMTAPVPIYPLMTKLIHIDGIMNGSRADAEDMVRAIERNQIHPVLDRSFGLDEIPAALTHMEQGKHVGKVTISVA